MPSGFQTTIIQGKTNHLDVDLMALAKDLLDGNSGVVGTNDLKVTQSDPVAMSVTVPAGVVYAYISSVASYYRHKLADAATVLTIDANSSGSTRYDLVCVKTDLTVTPDADGYGTATPVIVKGTPGGGVPSTPANHYKIAEVEVDNGAVSIANAKITDRRTVIQFAKVDTDGTLAANSDAKIPSQKATKTYVDALKKIVNIEVFAPATDVETGDSKAFIRIPSELNGYNLVAVAACVATAGTTGTEDIQIHRVRSGTPADMLSTKLTIDSGEVDTLTAATPAVIDTSKDDVATGDQIHIDIDAKHTTAAKGTVVELQFQKP